jgi:hypothetical protein
MLTPTEALGYVRARYTLGNGSDLERIGRQQAFMSSLIGRVQSELLNPFTIYRFLDAATRSLTIDSQLGGITGLYDLGQSLRGMPSDKIAFFTVPNFPAARSSPATSRTCCGRSRRTTRSSPRSATTSPRAAHCSPLRPPSTPPWRPG